MAAFKKGDLSGVARLRKKKCLREEQLREPVLMEASYWPFPAKPLHGRLPKVSGKMDGFHDF
jgi:hypothetical protein